MTGFGAGQRGFIFGGVVSLCVQAEQRDLAYPEYPRAGLQCMVGVENHLQGVACLNSSG